MNFLIALLSNSLANVLKDKDVLMTAKKLSVVMAAAEFSLLPFKIERISQRYCSWIIPKYFLVENNRVYLSRIVMANAK